MKIMRPQKDLKKTNSGKPINNKTRNNQTHHSLGDVQEMKTHTRKKPTKQPQKSIISDIKTGKSNKTKQTTENITWVVHSGIKQLAKLGLEFPIRVSTLTKLVGLTRAGENEPTKNEKGTAFVCLTITYICEGKGFGNTEEVSN